MQLCARRNKENRFVVEKENASLIKLIAVEGRSFWPQSQTLLGNMHEDKHCFPEETQIPSPAVLYGDKGIQKTRYLGSDGIIGRRYGAIEIIVIFEWHCLAIFSYIFYRTSSWVLWCFPSKLTTNWSTPTCSSIHLARWSWIGYNGKFVRWSRSWSTSFETRCAHGFGVTPSLRTWLYVGTRVWIWIWNWYGDVDLCVQQGGDEWWQKSQLVSGEQLALLFEIVRLVIPRAYTSQWSTFVWSMLLRICFFCCCCCHWRPSILMSRDTWKTSKTTSTLFWKRCMKTTLKSDLENGEPEVIGILIYDMIWYWWASQNRRCSRAQATIVVAPKRPNMLIFGLPKPRRGGYPPTPLPHLKF